MGFASVDDFISEVTVSGKFCRSDFYKSFNIGTAGVGRWYDMIYCQGFPPEFIHGNMVSNGHFSSGVVNWTLGSANWAWTPATHVVTRTASADGSTVSQNTTCVNGVSYSVVYTVTRSAGSVTISLGGTAGSARSSSATFRETIVCGAGAGAPLTITPDATFAGTVDAVAVTRDLGFTPYSDALSSAEAGIWHGGNVSADTKHLINFGLNGVGTTSAPVIVSLVDLLGVYPRIVTNSAALQSLDNTLTLPRYTTGAGVRAFYSVSATPGANARNFSMTYTNSGGTGSRSLGTVVAGTASAAVGHIEYTGTASGNQGPFLPLGGGDAGIRSVQSVQFSAASASAGTVDLVLCRPITSIPVMIINTMSERDLMNQLPSLPQIYDGACLGFIIFAGVAITTSNLFGGFCEFAWG